MMKNNNLILGMNASRNRSGGAKAYIIGILKSLVPEKYGIKEIHLWAFQSLLDSIPDYPWLIKHCPDALNRGLFSQLWWEFFSFPGELKRENCSFLFNTDAGTICTFRPSVVMSQDMLSYEKGEMERYGFSLARLRLIVLKYSQAHALKKADGKIFLTKYAANTIQEFTGKLTNYTVIPHGLNDEFRTPNIKSFLKDSAEIIKCIYVSNAALYKHQWHVVKAISKLRSEGYNLSLLLVGGGKGLAQNKLELEISQSDPKGIFVKQSQYVSNSEIPKLLSESDIFIFASSCENMPITLMEGMASGLPIACSDRGPMPEVLDNGGVYFDPENADSIKSAVKRIIDDEALRIRISKRSNALSREFSWERCSDETFSFISKCI